GKKDGADEAGQEDSAADDLESRNEGKAKGAGKGGDKGGADAGERAFLAYLAAPAPEVCLVLRCRQGRPDRRNKLVAAIEKAGGLAEAAPLPPARAVPYLAQLAEAAGKRCANPLLEQIVKGQPAGVGLAGAARELEKAIAYAGEAEELTAAMLREILIPSLEADIFRLVDALARQRRPEALRELRELLARGESPFGILAMITRQIRLIFWAKACQKAGYDRGQTARALGCHPFAADKAAEQSRRYTFPGLEAAMAILQETDLAMKSGRQSGQALEDLVIVLGEGRD
ncbi:MAG: DNA polymerase III subunit delta, partial [Peptococcaceae bacterium]|nr:DNA polymerase III subunit delta [Peptococcaceae bacterium]